MSQIQFQPLGNPLSAGERYEHIADIDPRMTRTHYFDGRLLTAEDLERDQIYLDQRLREIGKALGYGIISGLELGFDRFSGLLTLSSGQALSSQGRVLHVGSTLQVSLGNRALISQLNKSKYRKLNRALYAVVIKYVEVATDLAEVFPTDLGAKRGADYALVTEAVQMGLVPLPLPLPQLSEYHIRANLIPQLLGNSLASSLLPDDSVPLGVLAVQNDTPQWLDSELLRQPLRPADIGNALQQDLHRQYEKLLEDIFNSRKSGSLNNHFAASDYFSLLPPVGTLPKDSIDPMGGHQGYFPEHFNVDIAPIRMADIALIEKESMALPNIDLTDDDGVDIVALAPLSNQDFGIWASRLERQYSPTHRRLPQLDLLRLRLYPRPPVHKLDTDAAAWQGIWNAIGDGQLLYVRRPVRAAETAVSSIVLALGSTIPSDTTDDDTTSDSPSDSGNLIEDEDTVFLRFLNFKVLATIRPPVESSGEDSLNKLIDAAGDNSTVVRQVNQFLLRVERYFDPIIWQTLAILVERNTLLDTLERLNEAGSPDPATTGKIIIEHGAEAGLNQDILAGWEKLLDGLG